MNVLMELLQNRSKFIDEITDSIGIRKKVVSLLAIGMCSFAIYGFIMGLSNSIMQSVSSMVKLPLLYLATTGICFPTFFIFYSLFGAKTTLSKCIAYMLTSICVMGIILLAFAPVTLFFLLTSKNYTFFKLLNVLFFSVSGIVGVSFFYKMIIAVDLKNSGSSDDSSAAHGARNKILFFWLILYAFVGTQLAWTLRPFFGAPGMPFEFIRKLGGNFYVDVFSSFFRLFKL
ncbi:MAG: hypothetical protein K6G00_08320 [Treponema sp.]|nr:hypothetical protein [Treponema sp.]